MITSFEWRWVLMRHASSSPLLRVLTALAMAQPSAATSEISSFILNGMIDFLFAKVCEFQKWMSILCESSSFCGVIRIQNSGIGTMADECSCRCHIYCNYRFRISFEKGLVEWVYMFLLFLSHIWTLWITGTMHKWNVDIFFLWIFCLDRPCMAYISIV